MSDEQSSPTSWAALDRCRIAYREWTGGAPTLVFVHGWSGDRSHWHRQVPAFARHRRVALDLPGHGESEAPEQASAYSFDAMAAAVEAVMDASGAARAVLVGHSNGVPVIRQLYRRSPERVIALVAVDGALRDVLSPAVAEWMRNAMEAPDFERSYPAMVERTPVGRLSADDVERVKRPALAMPRHVLLAGLEAQRDPDAWRDDPVDVPLLVLHVEAPQWSQDYERAVRALGHDVRYEVWDDTTHFPMLEQPKRFNALVRAFLESLPEEGPGSSA